MYSILYVHEEEVDVVLMLAMKNNKRKDQKEDDKSENKDKNQRENEEGR